MASDNLPHCTKGLNIHREENQEARVKKSLLEKMETAQTHIIESRSLKTDNSSVLHYVQQIELFPGPRTVKCLYSFSACTLVLQQINKEIIQWKLL